MTLCARGLLGSATLLCALTARGADWNYQFGPGMAKAGWTQVTGASIYSEEKGYGFMAGPGPEGLKVQGLPEGGCTSGSAFTFAAKLPEGNYRVKVTLGNPTGHSDMVVKAQCRQLMLEHIQPAAGKTETREFMVNIRTAEIPGGGKVSLAPRELGPPLIARWQDRLTLEFNGVEPCAKAVEISSAANAPTLFLAGDSTVTDQPDEPWAAWGQMLPRFFKAEIAVANHAESGLALASFEGQKRLAKVLGEMKPGDFVFIQFGHNDQKDKTPGAGPYTTYKMRLEHFLDAVRSRKGVPVVVTSMERRRWTADGQPQPTLADFAEAARQAAQEKNVPVIDLNAMSLKFYAALGREGSTRAFVHYPAGTYPGQTKELKDDTHFNNYGAYELAKCVVEGIKAQVPGLRLYLRDDTGAFDPARPDKPEALQIPPSPPRWSERPAGS